MVRKNKSCICADLSSSTRQGQTWPQLISRWRIFFHHVTLLSQLLSDQVMKSQSTYENYYKKCITLNKQT